MPNPPLVLHLLPYDLARGAQVYARALRLAIDSQDIHHRTATLFEGPVGILQPDFPLDVSRRFRRSGFAPRAALALRLLVQRLEPDVLVTHGAEPLKYAAAVTPRSVPIVHYRIGISAVREGPRLKVLKAMHKRPVAMAGVSNEVLEEAVELFGVERERCVLIANGRDPERYRPATRRPTTPSIVFLGHFAPTKRPEVFVEVIRRLRSRELEFRAFMIGGGELLSAVQPEAEAQGIEVLGRREDVPELLQQATIFVFPSVPEGEGMPGVFIEAGLCGLATVATRVPGAGTVIDDGVTGHIVEPQDLDALTSRVEELVRSPATAEAMGAAARQRCAAQFTAQHSFDLWQEVLQPFVGS